MPFTAAYFGRVSLVGFIANLVIVPLSNAVLSLGMLAVALSYIWTGLAGVYALLTSWLTWILLRSVEIFGSMPYASVDMRFTVTSSILFYGVIVASVNLQKVFVRKVVLLCTLAAINGAVVASLLPSSGNPLRVTFLDVGQGDACFIEFPDGKTMLVDAGPSSMSFDAGSRFVVPFLKWKGIRSIDAIVVSHPHSDHLGGALSILRTMHVNQVIDAGSRSESFLSREYLRVIDSLNTPRKKVSAGDIIDYGKNVRIYVLHPSGEFVPCDTVRSNNLNNESVVLRIVYGKTSLLLTGDAEEEAESSIESMYGQFTDSDVLKVGHHGSRTSSTLTFLDKVSPALSVISVGTKNKFRHPSPQTLNHLKHEGSWIGRTDESGAIILESDGQQWRQVEWRSSDLELSP